MNRIRQKTIYNSIGNTITFKSYYIIMFRYENNQIKRTSKPLYILKS